jgi:hypothetical protein
MGYDLRYPKIAGNDREQLVQMKNYLYQLVDQLQWALNNISDSVSTNQANAISLTPKSQATATKSPTVDTQTTFNALKPLIIKSADIVSAYYEEINKRLEGEYVAQSDFGEFRQETVQDIEANSTGIAQFFTNLQKITTDIGILNDSLKEVNAHIKSGLLDDDIYGIEIGQTTTIDGDEVFNKYARFTSEKLSFYDKDTEVAYISGYKLYITNAEITGTAKFGAFLLDTSKGFTLKWAGRG